MRALERRAALGRARSARRTLASLRTLVDAIPNMVIADPIAEVVSAAMERLLASEAAWAQAGGGPGASGSQRAAALLNASLALELAERAFFDPSMLSSLYFPDDHKAAVYIPLFVPVLLPVIVALLRELRRRPAPPPGAAAGSHAPAA